MGLDGQNIPWLVRAIVVILIYRLVFPDPFECFSSIGMCLFSAHLAYASRACHFHPTAIVMINQEGLILWGGVWVALGVHVLFDKVFVISV